MNDVFSISRFWGFFKFDTRNAIKRAGIVTPASTAEKFLSILLNIVILFPAAFMVISLLGDALICLADHQQTLLSGIIKGNITAEKPEGGPAFLYISRLSCSMLFLLGATILKKRKIIGTLVAIMAFMALLMMILFRIIHLGSPNTWKIGSIITYNHFIWIFAAFIIIASGIATWFRLKSLKN